MGFKSGLATLVLGAIGLVGTVETWSYYNNKISEVKLEVPARVWHVEDEIKKIQLNYICLANNLRNPNFIENYRQLLMESGKNNIKPEVKKVNQQIANYSEGQISNCSILGAGSLIALLKNVKRNQP